MLKILVCGTREASKFKAIVNYRPNICNFIVLILLTSRAGVFIAGLKALCRLNSTILEYSIFSINSLEFNYIIIFDCVSLPFMGVVLIIASSVVFFSKDYMAGDPSIERFM
jgi:NADH-ubiquinone oxidoreductase chain 5